MVYFQKQSEFAKDAERIFQKQKKRILRVVPNADVQHIGSTAILGSLTKGDLDIQVRVSKKDFERAKKELSKLYDRNKGNRPTDTFVSFKDDNTRVPLGVQLTVMGSEVDDFAVLRDILLQDKKYLKQYNSLKKKFDGKSMREYRKEKGKFFDRIRKTEKFKNLKEFAAKGDVKHQVFNILLAGAERNGIIKLWKTIHKLVLKQRHKNLIRIWFPLPLLRRA